MNLQKQNMIDCQIRPFGVVDLEIIKLFEEFDRSAFFPKSVQAICYGDHGLEILPGILSYPPKVEALIIKAAAICADETVCQYGFKGLFLTQALASFAKDCLTEVDKESFSLINTDFIQHKFKLKQRSFNLNLSYADVHIIYHTLDESDLKTIQKSLSSKQRALCFTQNSSLQTLYSVDKKKVSLIAQV